MIENRIPCERCQKLLSPKSFFKKRDGTYPTRCKECQTAHIDVFNPETFLYLLEEMDFPYVEHIWNRNVTRLYDKAGGDPRKFSATTAFGSYLSQMRISEYKNKRWADTDAIAEQYAKKMAEANFAQQKSQEEYDNELKEKLEKKEITEEQYNSLASTKARYERDLNNLNAAAVSNPIGNNNAYNEENFAAELESLERDILSQLTEEDKLYLVTKWGRLYKPSEWITLEKKYQKMAKTFEIEDSDTEDSLILNCKNTLKMNQAIDSGDYDSYSKLARANDAMRKSSKFTRVQNKETDKGVVDCVGSLVAYCEKYGDSIPKYKIEVDYDIFDAGIRDMKKYNRDLIYSDVSLANQIEAYLIKKETLEKKEREEEAKKKAAAEMDVTIDDHMDFMEQQQAMRERTLAEEVED